MTNQPKQVGGGRKMFGDFAPKLAELTDDVLFKDVWNRPELAAQEELVEVITHVTLYAGWPKGMAAMGVAKQLFTEEKK